MPNSSILTPFHRPNANPDQRSNLLMIELAFIHKTLDQVAPFVRSAYQNRRGLDLHRKDDASDLLTQADLDTQRRIAEAIHEHFPGDFIVAEEEGMHALPSDSAARCWFIDPIDGTQNFVRGLFPQFGVSIGFAESGRVMAGGVSMPITGDLFLAERGGGATRNGAPLRVSTVDRLDRARVDIDLGYPRHREQTLARFSGVIARAGEFRCYCAAIVGLCSVAAGEAEAYATIETHPWDAAAGTLLVEEAGGRTTDFHGAPFDVFRPETPLLVTNGTLHHQILATMTPVNPDKAE